MRAFQVHVVLEGNGHACQGACLRQVARCNSGINALGCGQRLFFGSF